VRKNSKTEPFIMIPRSLLESIAWKAAGINTHRLLWFLMLEHMSKGGKSNGNLVAPRKQLTSFGIGSHFIGPAIAEADTLGLIDVVRGRGRAPNRYALTWLPLQGGGEASNRWRYYQAPCHE
jgi:hypothetical protein